MGELSLLIQGIKEGKHENFILLVKKMEPLIKRYIRYLYKDEKEDVQAELNLALWEAIINIKYVQNDGQIMIYLNNAIKNKFYELYRISRKKHDFEISYEQENIADKQMNENYYNNFIINEDITNFIKSFTGVKKEIYYFILVKNFSDTQIADKFNMSRQYVNRLRRKLRILILEEDFEI